jgi:3-oxoacyl-[acyl-carrier-protein] synthase III
MNDVYITDVAAFLPNNPVSNDDIEKCLGIPNIVSQRIKKIVLKTNDIHTRYYVIDPDTGRQTHTNTQMTADAIRLLKPYEGFALDDIECLCCGTSTPDQLMPGHGVMVHGELKNRPCEVVSTAGICLSGVMAMKYAYMNVALGFVKNAVAAGSEMPSTSLSASFFEGIRENKNPALKRDEVLPFDASFLRWMLSDGAGAVFMTSERPDGRTALRIDWIEQVSFASELDTCMYSGARKNSDGTITGWREYPTQSDAVADGAFLISQDVKLLNSNILQVSVEKTLPFVMKKHDLSASQVDWLLPHYSSGYFRQGYHDHLKAFGLEIPFEKWFTNLSYKGNTGAGSIYIILEEIFHSGRLKKGERVLCFIPESGRFSISYAMLTVV